MKELNNKIDFSTPIVMGILNVTDNSFYDGNRYNSLEKAVEQASKLVSEGAKIIDIGAQSSRPGSVEISEKEEWNRLKEIIPEIRKQFPKSLISVDTYRSSVAEKSINNGAHIINDISGGDLDENMFSFIAKNNVTYIMMHMKGTPKNMQNNPKYTNVVEEIIEVFGNKIERLNKLGANNLIIDPGFGFGKNLEHNYTIINNLEKLKKLKLPILIGVSRKSLIYNLLEINPDQALNGTTSVNTIALLKGANILRVHDVKEAAECIKIVNFAQNK